MSTLYLPVEVSKRELLARAFLSTRLAADGCSVVVFKADLFARTGWPGPGIYIGKNFLQPPPPHDRRNLQEMRSAGVLTYLLDEEGGIYSGETEADWARQLLSRYDPSVLEGDEKYLAWGEWQRRLAEAQSADLDVRVTGSPNFDLYQPKYGASLTAFDERETQGLSGFVLLNTRFVFANPLHQGPSHFIHHGLVTRELALAARFKRLASDGVRLYQFIGLIQKLSEALPEQMFVLRPHPNEDVESYRSVLAPLKNVNVIAKGDVGPWIRRCRALIHNGCTTAIQAEIAGKKVISYVAPPHDDEAVPGLPNRVGYRARSDEEVLAALADNSPVLHREVWKQSLGTLDSIEAIAGLVKAESELRTPSRLIRRHARAYDASDIPRKLRRMVSPVRRLMARKLLEHFDPLLFHRLPEIVGYAETHYDARVNIRPISANAYLVEPGKG